MSTAPYATRKMNLDDLDIFRSVVREGGVTRAARALHRVPSNITTRIKLFEERLGVDLFHRHGRVLTLTEAGRTLLSHADKLLHKADLAEQDMHGGVIRGVLRLDSLESAAAARLPSILSAFHLRNPQVTVELQIGTTHELLKSIEKYAVSAAFVSEPFENGALSSIPAFEEELVLITGKGAPAIRQAAELGGQTLVTFPHGCSYRQRLVKWLAEDGASPERILELNSYHAIAACVAAGTGAAVVPAEVLDHAVLSTSVQRHPLPVRLGTHRIRLVWLGEASAALQALISVMTAQRTGTPPDDAVQEPAEQKH